LNELGGLRGRRRPDGDREGHEPAPHRIDTRQLAGSPPGCAAVRMLLTEGRAWQLTPRSREMFPLLSSEHSRPKPRRLEETGA
jgi:hypothetical protein